MRKHTKRYIIFTSSLLVIFLIGLYIYKTTTGTLVCTYTENSTESKITSEYQAKYKNRIVQKVKTVEKITLSTKEEVEAYKKTLEEIYKPYNELEYYENNISIKDTTLNSVTIINYEKIDVKTLVEMNSNFKTIINKNNKIPVTKLKKLYEKNGAKCHYKN